MAEERELDPKWVAAAFSAVAAKMEPGDFIRKTTVQPYSYDSIVVITNKDRYFRINSRAVTYKPVFSARRDKAETIAENRA